MKPTDSPSESNVPSESATAPPTVEAWARAYVRSTEVECKFAPPPTPQTWEARPTAERLVMPGRPSTLRVATRAAKRPGEGALRIAEKRAELFHTFLHHELQAAELMAWALLAFPDAPRAFRMGLTRVLRDEVRHMSLYREYLRDLGFDFGDFPVRDWFWERVPACQTATQFVATFGIGFEGGNLDHTERFAALLRAAGDERGAALQKRIGEEEVPHVRFALAWFQKWTRERDDGRLTFTGWFDHLAPPLTPTVMRGRPLDRTRRQRCGMSDEFLLELDAWDR